MYVTRVVFFFQAEDGIRDLVRSRGLGDVYKRQPPSGSNSLANPGNQGKKPALFIHDAWTEFRIIPSKLYMGAGLLYWNGVSPVSYTHLTLPTSDLV